MRYGDPLRQARSAIQAGEFRHAWDDLLKAAGDVRASNEWQLLAAMAVWRLGDFARCRSEAALARAGYRASGDVDGEMRAENVAAAGSFALGNLDEAERGFLRARRLATRSRNRLLGARCANNLGNVLYYRGNHVEALNAYALAVAEFESEGFSKGLAEAWHNMGIVLRDLDQFTRAREAADRAIDFASADGDRRLMAQAMSSQAETLVRQGDVELSNVVAQRALDLAGHLEDKLTCIDATRVLSIVATEKGDLKAGLDYAKRAHELAREVSHPWMAAIAEGQLGLVHRLMGNEAEAREAFELAATKFESIGARGRATVMRERAGFADEADDE